ncbi:hypothetical protein OsI_07844 [Oryza sativa Indica Group]|uniref:Uncharacterized protein n=1 Tax=Oryza sativa subsp. indica TaxID=39946 RepID=A2X6K2_ORYSI|nr:hypothetical protein OsI_07844 [Oryza sativa Indica Group]
MGGGHGATWIRTLRDRIRCFLSGDDGCRCGGAMDNGDVAVWALAQGVDNEAESGCGWCDKLAACSGEVTGDVENNDADTWQSPEKPSATTMDGHVL